MSNKDRDFYSIKPGFDSKKQGTRPYSSFLL